MRRLLEVLALCVLGGCGGGGVPAGPAVAFVFPPPGGVTDQATIVVDGTARDASGVTVNGVPASSDDGFSTWRAEVPLAPGVNELVAATPDGAARTAVAVERTGPMFVAPTGVALDPSRGRALVVDGDRLLAVDLADGGRSEVALTGEPLRFGGRIAVDDTGRFAYVGGRGAVYGIDLDTGVVRIVTAKGVGAGISFSDAGGVRWEARTGTLLVSDHTGFGSVFRVDLATADRFVLDGVGFRRMADFVLDEARDRVVAAGAAVVGWDLDTAEEATLSAPPDLDDPQFEGYAFDPAADVLFAVDSRTGTVYAWDLPTGTRRVVSGPGPELVEPFGLAWDADRGRLLVVDACLDAVVAVDPANGRRTILSGVRRGSGPALDGIVDTARDERGRIYALLAGGRIAVLHGADRTLVPALSGAAPVDPVSLATDGGGMLLVGDFAAVPRLWTVDPVTGVATILSDAGHGSGPELTRPARIEFDGRDALVMDVASASVLRVDLETGNRTVVAAGELRSGPFASMTGLGFDAPSGRIVVANLTEGVVAIDPGTGALDLIAPRPRFGSFDLAVSEVERAVFQFGSGTVFRTSLDGGSVEIRGRGPATPFASAVLHDPSRNLLLVGDRGLAAILAVSPSTGERVILVK